MTHSSRPSLDGTQGAAAPFLQNLAQRLRKGSTASHASSQSSESNHCPPEPPALETASSTKRYLLSIVRNDWDYPHCVNDPHGSRRPLRYRQRDESLSDVSSIGSAEDKKDDKVYKFDNPDAVGEVISQGKLKKKRLLDEEMSWNDGLRLWTERRDAWTGALSQKPQISPSQGDTTGRRRRSRKFQHHRNSSESTANTTTSLSQSAALRDSDQPRNSSSSFEPFPPLEEHTTTEIEEPKGLGPYLPIFPPLLPASHALRARIKPTAYPTIYSRVVIQSMTPNVPIPLNYMIDALVDGWKSEGNWPPQAAAHGESAARGIYARKKKGETAFSRWRREQEERKRLALERMEKLEKETGVKMIPPQEEKQSRMRKSISGAMRKVLGRTEEDDIIGRDLAELGLKFEDENAGGAMLEGKAVAEAFQEEENVLLNKALLGQK